MSTGMGSNYSLLTSLLTRQSPKTAIKGVQRNMMRRRSPGETNSTMRLLFFVLILSVVTECAIPEDHGFRDVIRVRRTARFNDVVHLGGKTQFTVLRRSKRGWHKFWNKVEHEFKKHKEEILPIVTTAVASG
ncbi:hypothetical protein AB6A40_002629 [Gnathostoma spinigerum]|uniref:Uncharacterized protein n=1 Tax=Gnathostoma spinigerum TaxID=75299 RepID=A0ABD6E737_9BILA